MSKWENRKDYQNPTTEKQDVFVPEIEDLTKRKERIVEWTFEISKVLLQSQKISTSAVPGTAYHLALDIESYLRSVGLLPGLPEKK